jgi:hypothetical protein
MCAPSHHCKQQTTQRLNTTSHDKKAMTSMKKRAILACTLILGTAGVVWALNEQQTPASSTVKAEAITVVGKDGEDRIRMRMLDDIPMIELLDSTGQVVAQVSSQGESGQVFLTSVSGSMSLTAQPVPRFSVFDRNRNELIAVGLEPGGPVVGLTSANGRSRLTLQVEDVAAATPKTRAKLSVRSESPLEAGSATLVPDTAYVVCVDSDGEMSVEALSKRKQVLKLHVDPEGQPRLDLADDLKAAMRRVLGF